MIKRGVLLLVVLVVLASCLLPTGRAISADNISLNPDFETGDLTGWEPYGECEVSVETEDPHGGSYCAYVTDRTQDWNGIGQDIFDQIEVGKTYEVSAWVKVDATDTHQVKISAKRVIGTEEPNFDTVTASTVTGNQWTRISGSYSINSDVDELIMYTEGPVAGVSFYFDDFQLIEMSMTSENWKQVTDERIEEIRKGDALIKVVDANNRPVSGVTVDVKQKKHDFAFGSALARSSMYESRYTDFFKENFEWAVFENEAKWYSTESSQGNVSYDAADYMYEWCKENDITVRGHCVFWEVQQYVPSWVQNLSGEQLRKAIDDRLESVVPHFKGKFVDWDVNNEMLHGSFFKDKLGQDIWVYMYKRVRELDPQAKLFVNDYNVVSYAETDSYVQQIQWLLDNGAPIDAIGAQGHFDRDKVVEPAVVESRINNLASFGLPIWITEFDTTAQDVNLRADNLEKLYRVAFSNPAVEGIMMWGFWAGAHWRGQDATLVDQDWTVNKAGKRYQDLMKEWTTNTSGTTDSNGNYSFRGFHGTYEVTLKTPGMEPVVKKLELKPGSGTSVYAFALEGEDPIITQKPTDPSIVYGDLNEDGEVNSTDYALIKRHILGTVTLSSYALKAGDVNGDGEVNSTDYALVKRYILGLLSSFQPK